MPEDPTAFFANLYAAVAAGEATVPWDRDDPHDALVEWAGWRHLSGDGRRALVVGCGFGRDAELVAGLGFSTVAFDAIDAAIATARERHPGSAVDYVVADLLDPPAQWSEAFALVVESLTVQSLPPDLHGPATERVAGFVAPGGTLIVIASAADAPPADGPPWPLTRAEIGAFATGGVRPRFIERTGAIWRAELTRPDGGWRR